MGFFDVFQDEGAPDGGPYISKSEKADLIANATPVTISKVEFQPEKGYKGSDRYLLTVTVDGNDEERALSFGTGTVDSRDRMLAAMSEFLDANPGETVAVVIEEAGAAQLLVPA